ncbi:hypothetical protein C8R43DRAFT_1108194 [Mycena crocata]|nr:hypothetical protein C8R43DRAFT_1108194 [Mycena crocata]
MIEDRPQATPVEELWFPRDTIVIRAEDKLFQVSRAILAARSTVFSDMLAFPQPTGGDNEVIDGNPVVQLHDSAADVTVFLRAIFDSSYFMPSPAPVELQVVLGVLRLSHKYDVVYLHRRALQHLVEEGWYSVTHDAQAIAHHIQCPSSAEDMADSLAIAAVATEVGALWLIPWAYYMASRYPLADLIAVEAESPQHARKCIAAREHMLRAMIAAQRVLTVADACDTTQLCDTIRMGALDSFIGQEQEVTLVCPLDEWTPERVGSLRDSGLCDSCADNAATLGKAAASAFWDLSLASSACPHGPNYMQ